MELKVDEQISLYECKIQKQGGPKKVSHYQMIKKPR